MINVLEAEVKDNNNDIKANPKVDKEKQVTYPNKIYEHKNKIFQSSFKTYAVVNTWKICLTFVMVIAIHGSQCGNCAMALFGGLQDPAQQDSGIISQAWLMPDDFCKTATPFIIAVIGISTSLFCQRYILFILRLY